MKRMLAMLAVILLLVSACGTVESPEMLFAEKIGDLAELSYAYETVDGLELCEVTAVLPAQYIEQDVFAGKAEMIGDATAKGNTKSYVLHIGAVPTVQYIYVKTPDGWVHVYTTGAAEVTVEHDWYVVRSEKGTIVRDDDGREEAVTLTPEGYADRMKLAADQYRAGGKLSVNPAGAYTADAVYDGENVGTLSLDIPCPADADALAKFLR